MFCVGTDEGTARHFLEACDGDLNAAIGMQMDSGNGAIPGPSSAPPATNGTPKRLGFRKFSVCFSCCLVSHVVLLSLLCLDGDGGSGDEDDKDNDDDDDGNELAAQKQIQLAFTSTGDD